MKKFQFNWGLKIIVLYIGFILLILTLVFKSLNQKVDLVAEDYYAQELKYQDKIDGMNNFNELSSPIKTTLEGKRLIIQFPIEFKHQKNSGEILIFRPSDSSLDIKTPIILDENGVQTINNKGLKKGVYKIQISCTNQGKKIYSEQSIYINE